MGRQVSHNEWMESFYNDKVIILGEYNGCAGRILVRCVKCGREFNPTARQIKKGQGCRECAYKEKSKLYMTSLEDFDEKLRVIHNGTIIRSSPASEYAGVNGKVVFKCLKCGHSWKTTGNSVVNSSKTGCPKCDKSKYEDTVVAYLNTLNINCSRGITVGNCTSVNGGLSFFDIVFHDDKSGEMLIIEVDGEQHFQFCEQTFFRDEKKFIENVVSDNLKTSYCEKNNIPLLRIRYDQIKKSENYKEEIDEFIKSPENYISKHNKKYNTDELYYRVRYSTLKEKRISIASIQAQIDEAPIIRRNSTVYTDLKGNEYTSRQKLLAANHISNNYYKKRKESGMELEEILILHEEEVQYKKEKAHKNRLAKQYRKELKEKNKICYDHLGNSFPNKEKMCEYWDVSIITYNKRIARGESIEEALTKSSLKRTYVAKYGKTLSDYAREAGMSRGALIKRLKKMPLEEALALPLDERKATTRK